jgi:hypothetical protein
MFKKLTSSTVAVALITVMCGISIFANSVSNSNSRKDPVTSPLFVNVESDKGRTNDKLRTNMLRLVADAKAGKVAPAERGQIQRAKRNNLSKGTKIAIGVGIAVAVIAVIVIAKSPFLNDGQ